MGRVPQFVVSVGCMASDNFYQMRGSPLLSFNEILDGIVYPRMAQGVGAVYLAGNESTFDLMFALGSGLYAL